MKLTSYIGSQRIQRKLYGIAGAGITLAIPFLIACFHPSVAQLETEQSFCPMKLLTGLPCPGCGITKSLVFAYQGHFTQSLSYHLFGIPSILFCLLIIAWLSLEIITGKEYGNRILYNNNLAYVLAFALGSYHLVRTILFITQHSLTEILQESIWM